jgi:hypothetical protein
VTFLAPGGAVTVAVELALEPRRRVVGLMKRQSLPPDRGMLYVFPRQEDHPFWMRHTLVPLDLVFIDQGGTVVGIIADAKPDDATHLRVPAPSKRVLEVGAGFANRHGITPGTRVRFDNVPEGEAR